MMSLPAIALDTSGMSKENALEALFCLFRQSSYEEDIAEYTIEDFQNVDQLVEAINTFDDTFGRKLVRNIDRYTWVVDPLLHENEGRVFFTDDERQIHGPGCRYLVAVVTSPEDGTRSLYEWDDIQLVWVLQWREHGS